jgi:hypothetical protein
MSDVVTVFVMLPPRRALTSASVSDEQRVIASLRSGDATEFENDRRPLPQNANLPRDLIERHCANPWAERIRLSTAVDHVETLQVEIDQRRSHRRRHGGC